MNPSTLVTALLWIVQCVIALAIRHREGTWYSPASAFAGIWVVFTIMPIALGPVDVEPIGVAFVIAASVAVAAGAEAARRLNRKEAPRVATTEANLPLLEWLIVACLLTGLVTVELVLASRHRGPQVFLSLSSLVNTAHDFSVARYANTWQEPASARFLVSFNYLGALLAGVGLAIGRTPTSRWAGVSAIIPAAMLASILTTKASLIDPTILFASAFVATRMSQANKPLRVGLRKGILLVFLVAIGVFILGLVQMGRYGFTAPAKAVPVFERLVVDVLGYLGVFSIWLGNGGWHSFPPAGGFYTFAGIFDFLQIQHRPEGLYTDSFKLLGEPFNIYTAFRGLIQDFTLPGALVVLFVIGWLTENVYRRVRRGDLRFVAGLAAFYAFAIWTPVVDIYIYNTILLAYLMLAAYLNALNSPQVRMVGGLLDGPWRSLRPKQSSSVKA